MIKRFSLFIGIVSLTSSIAYANINAKQGFYVGGDFVLARYDAVKGSSGNEAIIPATGYIRPFVGYRFNDNFAAESGFEYLVNDSSDGGAPTVDILGMPQITGPDHYKLYAFDVAGKIIYPFANGFSVFGKIGAALVHQDVFNQTYQSEQPQANTNSNRLLPLIGAGISYNVNSQWATDLSVTHLQGVSPIGSIDMLGLGLSYTF